MKNESLNLINFPNALKWLVAARPKTWIASIAPVLIGVSFVPWSQIAWPLFLCTLFFSLCIQIGTNFANDYFDFIKGADTHERIGPKRAVQSGLIPPQTMRVAMYAVFGMSVLFAIPLMMKAGIWSLGAVLLCIALGVLYTGGPKPLGYLGLGDLLVLLFFGPIAVCGTFFLQTGAVHEAVFFAGFGPGFLSLALLAANNLRDEATDRKANKNTLVVRFGKIFGSLEYTLSLIFPLLLPIALLALYGASYNLLSVFFLFPLAIPLIRLSFSFKTPQECIPLLQGSAFFFFLYTVLFCLAQGVYAVPV